MIWIYFFVLSLSLFLVSRAKHTKEVGKWGSGEVGGWGGGGKGSIHCMAVRHRGKHAFGRAKYKSCSPPTFTDRLRSSPFDVSSV